MVRSYPVINITIEKVAKHCGVSKSTVSRVLNNHDRNFSVLPEKRELILRTAQELNYRPNVVARSLKKHKTKIVAILGFTTYTGPTIYSSLANRTVEALQKENYQVFSTFPDPQRGANAMLPWKVDGVIVLNSSGEGSLDEIEEAMIPYISINGKSGPNGISFKIDEKSGMKTAMDHLCRLGHTKIAYRNTAGVRNHYSVPDRHSSFLAECRSRGLPIIPGHDKYEIGAEKFLQEILFANHATALITYSHAEAFDLFFTTQRLGIDIPDKFSIMCFNDVYPCRELVPSITTLALPLQEMGTTAAKLLIEMMASDQSGSKANHSEIIFSEQLIVRESTASPKI